MQSYLSVFVWTIGDLLTGITVGLLLIGVAISALYDIFRK